jgi:hypothetical protein
MIGTMFFDALLDSAAMIPFLLVIYLAVEWFEHRFGETIETVSSGEQKRGQHSAQSSAAYHNVDSLLWQVRCIAAG